MKTYFHREPNYLTFLFFHESFVSTLKFKILLNASFRFPSFLPPPFPKCHFKISSNFYFFSTLCNPALNWKHWDGKAEFSFRVKLIEAQKGYNRHSWSWYPFHNYCHRKRRLFLYPVTEDLFSAMNFGKWLDALLHFS